MNGGVFSLMDKRERVGGDCDMKKFILKEIIGSVDSIEEARHLKNRHNKSEEDVREIGVWEFEETTEHEFRISKIKGGSYEWHEYKDGLMGSGGLCCFDSIIKWLHTIFKEQSPTDAPKVAINQITVNGGDCDMNRIIRVKSCGACPFVTKAIGSYYCGVLQSSCFVSSDDPCCVDDVTKIKDNCPLDIEQSPE